MSNINGAQETKVGSFVGYDQRMPSCYASNTGVAYESQLNFLDVKEHLRFKRSHDDS